MESSADKDGYVTVVISSKQWKVNMTENTTLINENFKKIARATGKKIGDVRIAFGQSRKLTPDSTKKKSVRISTR